MGLKTKIRNFRRKLYKVRVEKGEQIPNYREKGLIKFGICVCNRISIVDSSQQVWGDEMQARAIGRDMLRHCPQVGAWQLYDISEASRIDADIVFAMWPNYPKVAKTIKTKLFWLQNAGYQSRIKEFLQDYDYVFTASKKICSENKGIIYLPMACEDTQLFRKVNSNENFKTDVCFVGNYTKEQRPKWFQEQFLLPATKFDFCLWGRGWHRSEFSALREITKGRVDPKIIPLIYSSTKIVLANHCLVHKEEGMITTRVYEALACESFVISDRFNELEEEFGEYLIFTDGGKDLEEKIAYYLAHPQEREERTKGAREKVLEFHTFKNRVELITLTLGLDFSNQKRVIENLRKI